MAKAGDPGEHGVIGCPRRKSLKKAGMIHRVSSTIEWSRKMKREKFPLDLALGDLMSSWGWGEVRLQCVKGDKAVEILI